MEKAMLSCDLNVCDNDSMSLFEGVRLNLINHFVGFIPCQIYL